MNDRFAFGENWKNFASELSPVQIRDATQALARTLGAMTLEGLTFLDVGGGSGIHSLAARTLGATVHSFDYDSNSVECIRLMKSRHRPNDSGWTIEHGSALDADYLQSLGRFDVVYAWGVLHHTGDMWLALDLVEQRVKPHGTLFLALYNDQGLRSRIWRHVKAKYVSSSPTGKRVIVGAVRGFFDTTAALSRIANREKLWMGTRGFGERGMKYETDLVDWVGGYPFEVSRPDEIFNFYRKRGYSLEHLKTCGIGHGCNEFVFRR